MHKIKRAAIAALCVVVSACAPQTRFVWGGYEDSLYLYYRDPSQREVYRKALIDAVAEGRKTDRVAPGLCAEIGYLDLQDGNTAEAVSYFREEVRLFPESKSFLEPVIARAGSPSASGAVK